MDAYKPTRPVPEDSIISVAANSPQVLSSSSKSASLSAALTRLFETSHSAHRRLGTRLESAQVKRYQLSQPKEIFKALCMEDKEARKWLEQGIQSGKKSYLVVELHTAVDPAFPQKESERHSTDAKITVPVSMLGTGGQDILGLGSLLDSGPGVAYAKSAHLEKGFSLIGEYIFAIGYKKIVWKSWGMKKHKRLDKATLHPDIIGWTILGQKRGRDEEEELVSVDLTDDLVAKDALEENQEDIDDVRGLDDDEDDEDLAQMMEQSIEMDGHLYMTSIVGG